MARFSGKALAVAATAAALPFHDSFTCTSKGHSFDYYENIVGK
ncbi:hypothetical protein ACNHUS_30810 [Actinomycetes bacterium M1A6_2h]